MVTAEAAKETDSEYSTLDEAVRFRVRGVEKEALKRAADDADRKLANLARFILKDWLKQNGYLS